MVGHPTLGTTSLHFTPTDGMVGGTIPDQFTILARARQGSSRNYVLLATDDARWFLGWSPQGVGASQLNGQNYGSVVTKALPSDWHTFALHNGQRPAPRSEMAPSGSQYHLGE